MIAQEETHKEDSIARRIWAIDAVLNGTLGLVVSSLLKPVRVHVLLALEEHFLCSICLRYSCSILVLDIIDSISNLFFAFMTFFPIKLLKLLIKLLLQAILT